MSRLSFPVESACQYVELEQFFSQGRGELHLTYICHHPDRDGCTCVLNGRTEAECEFCQEGQEAKTVRI